MKKNLLLILITIILSCSTDENNNINEVTSSFKLKKITSDNQVQTFKHSNNLHQHTRNQNLLSEELQEYSPRAQARHFLDHKSKSIFNGMMAVGRTEEAHLYNNLYNGL